MLPRIISVCCITLFFHSNVLAHANIKTRGIKYPCLLKPAITYNSSMLTNKNTLLEQADKARKLENYCETLGILTIYNHLYGEDTNYWRLLARTYSDAGYSKTALSINNRLIKTQPNDEYLLSTQASSLYQENQPTEALKVLNQLKQQHPKSEETDSLNNTIVAPLKDKGSIGLQYVSLNNIDVANYIPTGPEYIHQNDSVTIYRAPLLFEKQINTTNTLIVKYQYENYYASIGSGLETINGHTNIYDNELYLGIKTIFNSYIQVQALVADLVINTYNSFLTYDIDLDFSPNDQLSFSIDIYRDLFRPINIYNGSPRMVSLRIIETSERAHLAYTPDIQTSVNADIRYGTFSDSNSYYYLILTPYRTFYNSEKTKISFGLDLEWEQFAKELEKNGYYSPSLYQSYQVSSLIRYSPTNNLELELYGAIGTVKDNYTPRYGFNSLLLLGGKYKLTKKLDIVSQISYLTQQLNPFYTEIDVSFGLNWQID